MLLVITIIISLIIWGGLFIYGSISDYIKTGDAMAMIPAIVGWVLILLAMYLVDTLLLGVVF